MSDPGVVVAEVVRRYAARHRRPGLWGALTDLVAPIVVPVDALAGVTLTVAPGEIVALLGPNGAGKSTLVKVIAGLLPVHGGRVRVGGLDPFADRDAHVRRLGVVFGQRTVLWWDLGVGDGLDLLATLHEVPASTWRARRAALVELLELGPLLSRPVRELSLGQRVRADLAAASVHAPPVLLLDEPTIGLDVAVKRRVRAFLRARASAGAAVLITTHDVGDVEALADRVVVLDAGRVVAGGAPADVVHALGARPCARVVVPEGEVEPPLRRALMEAFPDAEAAAEGPGVWRVTGVGVDALAAWLRGEGVDAEVTPRPPRLEDALERLLSRSSPAPATQDRTP